MSPCPKCGKGWLVNQPIPVKCDGCGFMSTLGWEPNDIRSRVMEALKEAQGDLAVVSFDPEASRRGDTHAMPATLGRVRSRVNRALALLEGEV